MAARATEDFIVCHPQTLQRFVYAAGDPIDPFHEWWIREQGCPVADEDAAVGEQGEQAEGEQAEGEQTGAEQAGGEQASGEQAEGTPEPVLGEQQPAGDSADDSPADFDPAQHTVADVLAYAKANPDRAAEVLAAEKAGRARTTILNELA